jgi:hypothetical protein
MPPPFLRAVAARHVLALATAEDLVMAADRLLTEGFYTYSLGRLGAIGDPRTCPMSEVEPLFASSLRDLEVELPGREEAIRILLRERLESVAEGAEAPSAWAMRFYPELYEPLFLRPWRPAAQLGPNESRELYNLWVEYDDLQIGIAEGDLEAAEGQRQFAAFEVRVLDTVRRWLRQSGLARFDATWLDCNDGLVRKVAETIRELRAFEELPILADALEEAGCREAEFLEHCRYPTAHVRGCWLLDLILDRE